MIDIYVQRLMTHDAATACRFLKGRVYEIENMIERLFKHIIGSVTMVVR
jgi:hypothetical protein